MNAYARWKLPRHIGAGGVDDWWGFPDERLPESVRREIVDSFNAGTRVLTASHKSIAQQAVDSLAAAGIQSSLVFQPGERWPEHPHDGKWIVERSRPRSTPKARPGLRPGDVT